ncbi:MAG: WG repeat-containing protein [Crocinitomicaceae bacterium]|nr:WG repeat-containing protein [Crocinitomicaceae bacterium]
MKFFKTLFALFFLTNVFAANKTWQIIDESGNVKTTVEAKYAYAFSDGLARIKTQEYKNNEWVTGEGYIDASGKIVIPCIYDKTANFVDGRAWVRKKGEKKYTLIDKSGNEIPTKGYTKVGYIMEGYSDRIAVYENGAMGWINRDGEEIIPCKYLGSSTFDQEFGLACVMPYDAQTEKYGFINKEGALVIPYQYKQAGTSSFHNGVCRAAVNGKTVMINDKGEVVFSSKHGSLQRLNAGLMAVPTKPNRLGWGFVNMKDEMVIPAEYDYVSSFNIDSLAVVEKGGLKGLINTKGELLIEMKYETIYCDYSEDGYICGVLPTEEPMSLLKTPKDYYNRDFQIIDMNGYTLSAADGENLIPFMTSDAKRGFMNRNFEVVIPAKYVKSTNFNGGYAIVREN